MKCKSVSKNCYVGEHHCKLRRGHKGDHFCGKKLQGKNDKVQLKNPITCNLQWPNRGQQLRPK